MELGPRSIRDELSTWSTNHLVLDVQLRQRARGRHTRSFRRRTMLSCLDYLPRLKKRARIMAIRSFRNWSQLDRSTAGKPTKIASVKTSTSHKHPHRQQEPYDAPWPNLYDDNGPDRTHSVQPTPSVSASPPPHSIASKNYSSFRVDIFRNVCQQLDVSGDKELRGLLQDSQLSEAICDFRRDYLVKEQTYGKARVDAGSQVSKVIPGRSQHEVKTTFLLAELKKSASSRFSAADVDKHGWGPDEHDLRFMMRVCINATNGGGPWSHLGHEDHRRALCDRAFWLMSWLRWLHKPSGGEGAESHRERRFKAEWLSELGTLEQHPSYTSGDTHGSIVASASPAQTSELPGSPPKSVHIQPEVSITDTGQGPYTVRTRPEVQGRLYSSGAAKPRSPPPSVSSSPSGSLAPEPEARRRPRKQQQRGLYWLGEDAWRAFGNAQAKRLQGWGVNVEHTGTCVLVPDAWANAVPLDLLESFDVADCLDDEIVENRLHFSLGDMTTTWARAAVWFNDWPHTGLDLDILTATKDGPHPMMHASHLCHHGLCINPNHIVYEVGTVNFSRNSCMWAARVLRAYGFPVPEHCIKHPDLSCMMQHAALTTKEAYALQFDVLQSALGVDRDTAIQLGRPKDHPEHFATFENRLPLSMHTTTVNLDPSRLLTPSTTADSSSSLSEKFTIRCRFCSDARHAWTKPTAAWAHLRVYHAERPRENLVGEVRRMGEAYASWADARFYDLTSHNPQTWAKIEQTRSADFNWDVVLTWRLHEARFHQV
ncbi:hypothetical protein EDD36DRAFT_325253 [Exophiala viscosa]|uniref:Zinc-binding loop region of homing endonuclease domain-containing protein n=1 Tax=Exophiala viscosa TaxID=2486360 RepID=A0AAN6DPD7_9EURO|nr:hypothetical protein EDD36DRAFT_325253 [Exophiala viscosa]